MRRNGLTVLIAIALLPVGSASADDAQRLRTRSLAAGCAGCHTAVAKAGMAVPALVGIDAAVLRAEMQAYKRGTRDGTVMPQIAKGYSDEQIDRLAAFFSSRSAAASR